MPSVFLAHSRNDRELVRQVYEALTHCSVHAWFDEAELRADDSLIQRISSGLGQVDFIAVFLSEGSIRSDWIQHELESASVSKTVDLPTLIPVRLPDLPDRLLPTLTKTLFRIDYTGDVDNLVDRLLETIVRDYDGAASFRISIDDPPFGAGTKLSWMDASVREWRTRSKTGRIGSLSPLDCEHRITGESDAPTGNIIDVVTLMGNSGNKVWHQASRWLGEGQFEALVYLREGTHEDMRIVVSIYQPMTSMSALASRRVFTIRV